MGNRAVRAADHRIKLSHLVVLGLCIKLLLFPAYFSTDFDVHRNWLAITHNLPLGKWYYEATSQWTLDYPPLFAYFEYALSFCVPKAAVDDGCLRITASDGQFGWPTVVFQRSTVVITELVLAYSLSGLSFATQALVWLNPGCLILDHIHFQYNTAMFGIFILSLRAMTQQKYLKSSFTFATLLCFKHIYLYVAPAYVVFLLKHYVWGPKFTVLGAAGRLTKLGISTLTPFVVAFTPLLLANPDSVGQVLSRLFPFSRGLTHAYWAPNFWALYSAGDRILGIVNRNSVESATRGIVGQVSFANFSDITPSMTFLLTLVTQLVSTLGVSSTSFEEGVTLCAFASFLFGWHVHEKAVMTVVVPFALISRKSAAHFRAFLPLLVSSCFSLFPLIFTSGESLIKTSYTVAFLVVANVSFPNAFSGWVGWLNAIYIGFFAVVVPLSSLIPTIYPKYEYAGLMLISVYSSLGVVWSWLQLLVIYFQRKPKHVSASEQAADQLMQDVKAEM